jgi:hypothetical protein
MARPSLRFATFAAGAASIASLLASLALAQNDEPARPSAEMSYRILRNGDAIGTHELRMRSRGDRLALQHKIHIQVSIAGFDAYVYDMTSSEFWEGDRLTRFSTHTNKNGTRLSVSAALSGANLRITGGSTATAPATAVPDSPHFDFLRRRPGHMIDAESGRVLSVRVSGPADETIRAGNTSIPTRRYRVSGDLDGTYWYRADGVLVKKRLIAPDGSEIFTVVR